MKNIHVLPTDNPSRLFEIDGHLIINREQLIQPKYYRNIYITSDEEIKEGDWCIDEDGLKKCTAHAGAMNHYFQKIILTTDTDLIKDGVQEIKDEFLEWFVKNPNCEFVETLFHYPTICDEGDYSLNLGYWTIIIPKEEHKQETVEEAAEKWVFETNSHKWSNNDNSAGDNYGSFLNGAKWQAERMYSEEEVKKLLISCKDQFSGGDLEDYHSDSEVIEWFKKRNKN